MKKYKDIKKLSQKEKKERLGELRLDLMKRYVPSQKGSKIRSKNIKKDIARLLSTNNQKILQKKMEKKI